MIPEQIDRINKLINNIQQIELNKLVEKNKDKRTPFGYYFDKCFYLVSNEAQMFSLGCKVFTEENKPIPLYK